MVVRERTAAGEPLFPWKLHKMLEDAEEMGFDSIVSWLPGGKVFHVRDTINFETHILPQYFNQSHYKSFQRQLNIYGFHRLSQGIAKGAYFHHLLVRGKPDLCRYMVRTKIKGKNNSQEKRSFQQGLDHITTGKLVKIFNKKVTKDNEFRTGQLCNTQANPPARACATGNQNYDFQFIGSSLHAGFMLPLENHTDDGFSATASLETPSHVCRTEMNWRKQSLRLAAHRSGQGSWLDPFSPLDWKDEHTLDSIFGATEADAIKKIFET